MFDEDTTATQYLEQPKERAAGAKIYFCEDCQSVLEPRAIGGELEYFCKQCKKSQKIDDNLVYVNILKRTTAGFTTKRSLVEDPTLPVKKLYCSNCGAITDHVIFTASKIAGEETMSQMIECKTCLTQSEMPDDD